MEAYGGSLCPMEAHGDHINLRAGQGGSGRPMEAHRVSCGNMMGQGGSGRVIEEVQGGSGGHRKAKVGTWRPMEAYGG